MVYVVETTGPTGEKMDAGFIAFANPSGPAGPDAAAAAVTIHEIAGGALPPGGADGDLVVDKLSGDIRGLLGGALVDSPRVPTGPAGGRSPLIGGRGYLVGTTGDTGQAGAMGSHAHPGAIDIIYRPTLYKEMWWQSYVPVLPPPPTVVGPITLTNGVGNDVQVTIPPESESGLPHPFPGWQRAGVDLPSIDFSRLRVAVIRSAVAPVNPSPWLGMSGIVDYTDVVAENVRPGQTIPVSLSTAWPVSGTDPLWVVSFLWDRFGNGPVASAPVQAAVTHKPPPVVDLTPPGGPKITVVWDPNTGTYTVTIIAPNDPDVKEIHYWLQPSSTTPDTLGPPVVIQTAPGQVHTFTFTPKTDDFPYTPYPPNGWQWTDPTQQHGVIQVAGYVLVYDKNGNGSSPAVVSDYKPASGIIPAPFTYVPPPTISSGGVMPGGGTPGVQEVHPPILPKPPGMPIQHHQENSHMTRAKSRAYDKSGTRADNQWGAGVMHTGNYGPNHGTQWGGSYINLTHLKGWRVTEFTVHWTSEHAYYNDGATYGLGWHSFKNGMPSTCVASRNGAYFGNLGQVHAPKNGPVSRRLSTTIGQKFVDGQAFGFLFGGPADHTRRAYASIDINSVWVHIEVER